MIYSVQLGFWVDWAQSREAKEGEERGEQKKLVPLSLQSHALQSIRANKTKKKK